MVEESRKVNHVSSASYLKNTVDEYKINHIPNVSTPTKNNNEERKYKT